MRIKTLLLLLAISVCTFCAISIPSDVILLIEKKAIPAWTIIPVGMLYVVMIVLMAKIVERLHKERLDEQAS